VQGDLRHARHADEVVGLLLVVVPGLDDPGVDPGYVRLAEPLVVRVIGTPHLHEHPPVIGDDLQVLQLHTLDHARSSSMICSK